MSSTFVPPDFEVPTQWRYEQFWLWPLGLADLDEAHVALMESEPELHALFSPAHRWPAPDLTPEQHRRDLLAQERAAAERTSFAYVIGSSDGQHHHGCVYLFPTTKPFDMQAYFWLRRTFRTPAREEAFLRAVRSWLTTAWLFQKVVFPGRTVDWDEWSKLEPPEPPPLVD